MPRTLHPLTTLGLLCLLGGPMFLFAGYHPTGTVLLFLAYALPALEFKKYTSDFQFAMLLLAGPALGIAIDLYHSTWPVVTTTILLCSVATIARQKYMQRFTYINLLWLDSGLATLAALLHTRTILTSAFAWDLWLAPLVPICGALFLTYAYVQDGLVIRRNVRRGYRVKVGQPAPSFELPDEEGTPVRLEAYRGKHPVLLVFVRGDWCPGCHMMLRTYERNRATFLEKGVHVLGIGPDDISVNKDMVRRIGVGFRMLSDNDQAISRIYGVVYNNPAMELAIDYSEGIPLPASFLVDTAGVVRYVSRPERVGEFLKPELIFNTLAELPAGTNVAWS